MIDLWQEIYGTIKRNKLRTFLTGFAVAWGIFMLIVLLGAGNGIIHAFEQNASERALNSIRLGGGWTTQSYEGLKEGRRIQLENKDLAATEKYFPDNIITAGATLRQGDVNISFGQEYIKISGITSKNGRNDAKRLNIRVVTVSNDDKPKNRKTQRKADLRRRMVCKSLPVKE